MLIKEKRIQMRSRTYIEAEKKAVIYQVTYLILGQDFSSVKAFQKGILYTIKYMSLILEMTI